MNRHLIRSAFAAATIAVVAFVPLNAGSAGSRPSLGPAPAHLIALGY